MQINQQDAAKDLGWTQGAFSQYLNSITKLNTAAVIKIANYLGVPASAIDPDISSKLPAIHHIKVRYQNKSTTPLKNKGALVHTVSGSTSSMIIEITEKMPIANTQMYAWPGQKAYVDHTAVVQKKMRTIPSRSPHFITFSTKSAKDREFTVEAHD
jgi:transcriptional regulator with XRE-family HTH domain